MADRRQEIADAKRKLRQQLRQINEIEKRTGTATKGYEAHRDRAARRQAELSESGRDIGPLPAVVDPERRAAAEKSFLAWCESYFPATFSMPWSDDHREVIAALEKSVVEGGLFAFAMPRGSGKTSLTESAALWALLCGYRDFVAIVGASEDHAHRMLESIKVEAETNDELLADFPEAVFPIHALERIHQRAKGQLFQGRPTHIQWTSEEVQFPAIPGSKAAGGIIRVAGITGGIRGMSAKRAVDGRKVRPSLVLIDDPQTDEAARSPAQVAEREAVLQGAILGLAGPGAKIAGLCTVTVIRPDDLADRLLDRTRHPSWQGKRTKMVYQWPAAEELWQQYAELRREGQRSGAGTAEADAFYQSQQATMDAGAVVAWPARMFPGELSAIQHAWNLRIDRKDAAFFAEYQNEPIADAMASDKLDKRSLATRVVPIPRGVIPANHTTLTAYVDVQERLLYWAVCSWSASFGGHLVAYGAYPDQGSSFFEAQTAKRTLASAAKGAGFEAALRTGLDALMPLLLGREWVREDGAKMRIGRLLVDAAWGRSTQVVRNFARQTPFAAIVLPSQGKGIGATSKPMAGRRGRGDQVGLNWIVGTVDGVKQRQAFIDTNFWKTFTAARLKMQIGDPEGITIHDGSHDLLFEHLVSEYPVNDESKTQGRRVDVWKKGLGENHWWDCLVGSACAASISGVTPASSEAGGRVRRKVELPAKQGDRKRITVRRAV